MANIFRYESNINESNKIFIQVLSSHAESGKPVNLSDLVTQYAFDTLFSVTTGKVAGFMQGINAAELKIALQDWKFKSIASGSYMRLHLSITRALRTLGYKSFDKQVLTHLNSIKAGEKRGLLKDLLKKTAMTHVEVVSARAACAALIVAESDALVTHIGATLFYIYHDVNVLKELRTEIAKGRFNHPAKLKDIIRNKDKMPYLYTTLRESLRQWREYGTNGASDFDSDVESVAFGQQDLSHDLHLATLTKIILHVVAKFDVSVSAGIGEHHYSSTAEAVVKHRGQSTPVAPAISKANKGKVVSAWRTFAVETATEYQKQVDSYIMPIAGEPIPTVDHKVTETFKVRAASKVADKTEKNKAALPPHLRKKE